MLAIEINETNQVKMLEIVNKSETIIPIGTMPYSTYLYSSPKKDRLGIETKSAIILE